MGYRTYFYSPKTVLIWAIERYFMAHIWNWQQKDWPDFRYDLKALSAYEDQFLHKAGLVQGSLLHIGDTDKDQLRIQIIQDEAYKTSEIEGEILSRESLQSSIQRHFGIQLEHAPDYRKIPAAEYGIAEMLVDLYKGYQKPLNHQTLFDWHAMLTNGRRDLQDIGRYRTDPEPMQIVSGPLHDPTIHFEAPPSGCIQKEMDMFVAWFNRMGTSSCNADTPILARSAITHIYFETIHPFEDGNGRIGRALSVKALAQGLKSPLLIALSQQIERSKKAYYVALQDASKRLDIQEWLEYFCQAVLAAQDLTQDMILFLVEKSKFYERFAGKCNDRQLKVIRRMFAEGVDGFKGGLSAKNYMSITGTLQSTATRDLQDLVKRGALRKEGERRHTRYYLNIAHNNSNSWS